MSDKRRTKKTIKKTIDGYGIEKTAEEWIKQFLRKKKTMRFGEIQTELEKQGIGYKNNKGLDRRLKMMIEDGMIKKKDAKPYPYYYLSEKAITDIEWVAEDFKQIVAGKLLNYSMEQNIKTSLNRLMSGRSDEKTQPHPLPLKNESREEYRVRDLLQFYGAYMLYVQIQSWNITESEKSLAHNYDLRQTWFLHTILNGQESLLFEQMITDVSGLTFHKTPEEYDAKLEPIYANKKKLKKFKEIEEIFKRQYKPYCDFFDSAFQSAPERARISKAWIKEMKQDERRKERQNRKRKNIK